MVLLISTGLLLHSMAARLDYSLASNRRTLPWSMSLFPVRPPRERHLTTTGSSTEKPSHPCEEEALRPATESASEAVVAQQELFYEEPPGA